MREITVRIDTGKVLRLFTNDLTSPAEQIAELYKERWQIELFFKWIKQNLKITRFLGTSENAIRSQIAVAFIAYLLVRLIQQAQRPANTAPPTVLLIVRTHLFVRRPDRAVARSQHRQTARANNLFDTAPLPVMQLTCRTAVDASPRHGLMLPHVMAGYFPASWPATSRRHGRILPEYPTSWPNASPRHGRA